MATNPFAAGTQEQPAGNGNGEKKRKTPNRRKNADDMKFILDSYKDKSTSEIAHERGLTRQQVYKTINDARKSLQEKVDATTDPAKKKEIQDYMELNLPHKEFGGGAQGARGSALDAILTDKFSV